MDVEVCPVYFPEEIQAECLRQLDIWESNPQGPFDWPMDRVASQSYGYIIHYAIVDAWNREGRVSSCADFHRAWLNDLSNIQKALGYL